MEVDAADGDEAHAERTPVEPVVDFYVGIKLLDFNFAPEAAVVLVIHAAVFDLDFGVEVSVVAQLVARNEYEAVRVKIIPVAPLRHVVFGLAIKIKGQPLAINLVQPLGRAIGGIGFFDRIHPLLHRADLILERIDSLIVLGEPSQRASQNSHGAGQSQHILHCLLSANETRSRLAEGEDNETGSHRQGFFGKSFEGVGSANYHTKTDLNGLCFCRHPVFSFPRRRR